MRKELTKVSDRGKNLINLTIAALIITSSKVIATTADAPWVGMLDKVMRILTGPTSRIIAIIAIAAVGFMFMFGNTEAGAKKGFNVFVGISIVFAAVSWGPKFFGYSGALLM